MLVGCKRLKVEGDTLDRLTCKRVKVEGDTLKLDRLTDLPINLKHGIQEHLSIEEAAKMSVLSRPWRHVWASIPKLVFSAQFCNNKPSDTLIDTISTILLQHVGAIKTFLVNISKIPSAQHPVIDEWMLLLSRNGLKDLTLENLDNARYKLPSYIYRVELESLKLSTCIFRPPCNFRGFHKLKSLSLHEVVLELDDVATSLLWMPNLESLRFMSCKGLHHLKIYAPELLLLSYFTSGIDTLRLGHFMDCRKLKTVLLASHNQDKAMNLTNLLSGWPKVRRLLMDSYYLKPIASGIEADSLNSLRVLTLHIFNFDDEDQISSLLRMLSSSPNLNALLFSLRSKKKGDVEVTVNHFGGPTQRRQRLNKLKRFDIDYFHGSKAELLFVRFILASAPLLRTATLLLDESVHEGQHLKISKELMGFHRASPKLEITCEPLKQTEH